MDSSTELEVGDEEGQVIIIATGEAADILHKLFRQNAAVNWMFTDLLNQPIEAVLL